MLKQPTVGAVGFQLTAKPGKYKRELRESRIRPALGPFLHSSADTGGRQRCSECKRLFHSRSIFFFFLLLL